MTLHSLTRGTRWAIAGILMYWATYFTGALSRLGWKGWPFRAWSKIGLWGLNVKVSHKGKLPPKGSLVASNHLSYMDILVLGSIFPGTFMAKSEIQSWPVVGWAATSGGSIFITRENMRKSQALMEHVAQRIGNGDQVVLFAEGGIVSKEANDDVSPFHSMFFDVAIRAKCPIIPTRIVYTYPEDPRVWKWLSGMSMGEHIKKCVFPAKEIRVEVNFGEPIMVAEGQNRKEVAQIAYDAVVALKKAG